MMIQTPGAASAWSQQPGDHPPSAYAAAWNESLGRLDVASYPTLRDLRSHLITAASSEQFDYGLRRLVDSLQPPG